jgi:hypothetical protein
MAITTVGTYDYTASQEIQNACKTGLSAVVQTYMDDGKCGESVPNPGIEDTTATLRTWTRTWSGDDTTARANAEALMASIDAAIKENPTWADYFKGMQIVAR